MDRGGGIWISWRAVILAPAILVLLSLALYFYDNLQPEIGLALLGVTFALPMGWVILAAREAEYSDSPLGNFIPRLTVWLVIGSVLLGAMHWNVNRRISLMEAGFAVLYLAAAYGARRILAGRPKRPQLTALSGGNLERRNRRRAK
jgi:hypothetical protein